ncbi:MAG: MBL fold metallo-hydrolase [Bacteroidales bacterium]|nr:MBL fold metallo-hydrolase [Bacteroidales bacterium]
MEDKGLFLNRIRYSNVAGFLVYNKETAVLIDCGHPHTVGAFTAAMERLGIPQSRIRLIILTHTHFDHAGGAGEISRLTGAPVAVHYSEVKYLENGYASFPRGTRWKGKSIVFIGRIFARRLARYAPVKAGVVIEDEMDLQSFGIPGKIVHTPGHTEGSLSVLLENGNAMVGDNVLGISDKQHFPPFANDCGEVIKSWEYYINSGVEVLHPAHGKAVEIASIRSEIDNARKRYV